ncbi:hypothetical protein AZH53_10430 [Methanomicrobiaceae archaeon CYW5]|uniref:cyclase family protein n=1 Tax=Methanovulcanius yangii TaxID=1789227 RepID=UPI0029CA35D3|nr:cyclase family protein [Methanovulcanius yangii]MBT8508821.1 hypothetical protein [Methanovulcanius yangii]
MALHDCTRPFPEPPMTWPGDPVPTTETEASGEYTITRLTCASHNGTHIDAPAHLVDGGMTVDEIPLPVLLGPVTVIDLSGGDGPILPEDLKDQCGPGVRILVKTTDRYVTVFDPAFRGLSPAAAECLANAGVILFGIDTPSVEEYGGDGSVHLTLLGAGMPLLENVDLTRIAGGDYYLIALPLRLTGGDGAQVRVILSDTEEIFHGYDN